MRVPIILRNLEEMLANDLCEITASQVETYEDYKDIVETEDNVAAEVLDYWDIKNLLGEIGYTICELQKSGKLVLTDNVEPETGAGCRLTTRECEKLGGKPVGSFHTHPVGGNTPSIADIECSLKKELFFCIGGYDGDDHRVTCYTPWPRIRERGIMYNPLSNNPYYPRPSVPPDGKINFWREEPAPTAQDLLEDGVYKYWSDEPEEQEAFRKMLEEGEIPDEAWENYESAGENDSLDIYTPEKLKVVEAERKEFLKRDFDVMEVECR